MWPSLETTPKTITVAENFVFITLGTLNRPDLHFESAGNGPVVITWISREHELYSGEFPISLVEHWVTFRHDRRLLSILGFVHNWPTSRWSATKKKKENRFSLNRNEIMSSFLGKQFHRSTLYIYILEEWFKSHQKSLALIGCCKIIYRVISVVICLVWMRRLAAGMGVGEDQCQLGHLGEGIWCCKTRNPPWTQRKHHW